MPGANTGYPGNRQMGNELGGVSLAVNGARTSSNNYLIDGVDNNGGFNGYFSLSPSVDSIQEFKVQTNSYSAEFGRSAGAQINVVSRAGTNGIMARPRNSCAIRSWTRRRFSPTRPESPPSPHLSATSSAPVWGGPVLIPRLYNGKDKTFFFFSYEGTRIRQAVTRTSTVPTAALRAGDFSGFATVYDPLNVVDGVRQPFPGNRIPDSRISAASRFLQDFVPAPIAQGFPATSPAMRPTRTASIRWACGSIRRPAKTAACSAASRTIIAR